MKVFKAENSFSHHETTVNGGKSEPNGDMPASALFGHFGNLPG